MNRIMVRSQLIPAYVIAGLLLLCCSFGSRALASETDINWTSFNLEIVKNQIIPKYEALSLAAATLEASSQKVCSSQNEGALEAAKSAFGLSMNAWQGIQHVNFGPIEYAMRSASLQFWPDKKNHIGKQLNQLILSEDAQRIGEKFTKLSVSVKGLPAIERLLYSQQAREELIQGSYRCQVLVRISENISEISRALASEWQSYMLAQFEDASQVDGFFEDEIDAATALLKTIIEPIEIIRDLKLKRPLGSQFGKQKYKRLESWRSQRSLRNIRLNINVIGQAYPILKSVLAAEDISLISNQLDEVESLMNLIPSPLESSIQTESGYQQAALLVSQLTLLHQSLEQAVSRQGIHLGFNSRDGD